MGDVFVRSAFTLDLKAIYQTKKAGMKGKIFCLMAITCALAVANLYYNQPILVDIANSFEQSAARVGWIPTLTQVGYALGLLMFVPLGDLLERRKLITVMLCLSAIALFVAASAPTLNILILASFGIGAATISAQIIIPLAADIVPIEAQGKAVGSLMSALFIGVLLARPLAGYLGEQLGWRSVYWLAGTMMLILAIASAKLLPKVKGKSRLSYPQLWSSLGQLVKAHPTLRRATLVQGLLFGTFSIFWSTLAFLLTRPPHSYGSKAVGLFGLVGIAGIIVAPLLGKLADRGTAKTLNLIVSADILLILVAYLIFWQFSGSLLGIVTGSILLNLGSQGALVANQITVYSLDSQARSRLNTVLMVGTFLGGSFGSVVGTYGWNIAQWTGVCAAGLLLTAIAALILWLPKS